MSPNIQVAVLHIWNVHNSTYSFVPTYACIEMELWHARTHGFVSNCPLFYFTLTFDMTTFEMTAFEMTAFYMTAILQITSLIKINIVNSSRDTLLLYIIITIQSQTYVMTMTMTMNIILFNINIYNGVCNQNWTT